MRTAPLALVIAAPLLLSACAITQTATPVSLQPDHAKEICVIEDPEVFDEFLPALRESLTSRGLEVRLLSKDSPKTACPLTATYVAYRSWDFKVYMSEANVQVYRSGEKVGEAIYDAPKTGMSLSMRIYESTESKVETMVSQLFPTLPRRTSLPKAA